MGLLFGNFIDEIIVDFIVFIIIAYLIGSAIFNKFYSEPI